MSYQKTGFIVDADDAKMYGRTGKKVVAEFYWLKGPKHGEFPTYKFYSGSDEVATLHHEKSVMDVTNRGSLIEWSMWIVTIRNKYGGQAGGQITAYSEGEALSQATAFLLRTVGLVSE